MAESIFAGIPLEGSGSRPLEADLYGAEQQTGDVENISATGNLNIGNIMRYDEHSHRHWNGGALDGEKQSTTSLVSPQDFYSTIASTGNSPRANTTAANNSEAEYSPNNIAFPNSGTTAHSQSANSYSSGNTYISSNSAHATETTTGGGGSSVTNNDSTVNNYPANESNVTNTTNTYNTTTNNSVSVTNINNTQYNYTENNTYNDSHNTYNDNHNHSIISIDDHSINIGTISIGNNGHDHDSGHDHGHNDNIFNQINNFLSNEVNFITNTINQVINNNHGGHDHGGSHDHGSDHGHHHDGGLDLSHIITTAVNDISNILNLGGDNCGTNELSNILNIAGTTLTQVTNIIGENTGDIVHSVLSTVQTALNDANDLVHNIIDGGNTHTGDLILLANNTLSEITHTVQGADIGDALHSIINIAGTTLADINTIATNDLNIGDIINVTGTALDNITHTISDNLANITTGINTAVNGDALHIVADTAVSITNNLVANTITDINQNISVLSGNLTQIAGNTIDLTNHVLSDNNIHDISANLVTVTNNISENTIAISQPVTSIIGNSINIIADITGNIGDVLSHNSIGDVFSNNTVEIAPFIAAALDITGPVAQDLINVNHISSALDIAAPILDGTFNGNLLSDNNFEGTISATITNTGAVAATISNDLTAVVTQISAPVLSGGDVGHIGDITSALPVVSGTELTTIVDNAVSHLPNIGTIGDVTNGISDVTSNIPVINNGDHNIIDVNLNALSTPLPAADNHALVNADISLLSPATDVTPHASGMGLVDVDSSVLSTGGHAVNDAVSASLNLNAVLPNAGIPVVHIDIPLPTATNVPVLPQLLEQVANTTTSLTTNLTGALGDSADHLVNMHALSSIDSHVAAVDAGVLFTSSVVDVGSASHASTPAPAPTHDTHAVTHILHGLLG